LYDVFHYELGLDFTDLVEAQIQMSKCFVFSKCSSPSPANISILHHLYWLWIWWIGFIFLLYSNFIPAKIEYFQVSIVNKCVSNGYATLAVNLVPSESDLLELSVAFSENFSE